MGKDKKDENNAETKNTGPEADKEKKASKEETSTISKFRLSQDFGANLQVKKLLLTVPVRKPHNQEWIRTHPSPEYSLTALVLDLKEEREIYLVNPTLGPDLGSELKVVELRLAVNRQGTVFIWSLKLPGADGRIDAWLRRSPEMTRVCSPEMDHPNGERRARPYARGDRRYRGSGGCRPPGCWPQLVVE